MTLEDKLIEVSDPIRQQIIDFHENELPDIWQADIPDQNLAVDGAGRAYAFRITDIGFEEYHNIKYYVNRPVNEEYFLTIMAFTRGNKTCVDVILCEGFSVVGFNSASREADYNYIESKNLEQVDSEEELPEHFDDIRAVVKQFAQKYKNASPEELKQLAL